MTSIDFEALRSLGRTRWSAVDVSEGQLRGVATVSEMPAHPEDFYLALACVLGDRDALSVFERELMSELPATLFRAGVQDAHLDDVQQQLRERLLVSTADSPARLLSYSGKGPLGAWVRVCGARAGVDHCRARRPAEDTPTRIFEQLAAFDPDLETLLVSDDLRGRVRAAFSAALASLPTRLANTLRYRVLDGLASNEIAKIHEVHRASVDRWLLTAKEHVLSGVQRRIMNELGLDRARARSAIGAVVSQLDLSLSAVFGE
ncbi:MAG: hypothetical protein ACRBN8_43100 [Nannocystales bacterium]